ncbi:MAG: major facilitator superfamily 1 [Frankiales bacterium]|nr:major facilitator superfamily 1 [Frankiales bacterium]
MFRSLANRNYRLFATGQVISLSGTWAQRVAQDWLVLLIVPKQDAAVALGITTALQFLPMLLFGLYGGVLADRYDKRRLLIGAQISMGLLALTLGVLDLTGVVQLWHVYALAFGLGLASVVDTPARQSFVSELVGTDDLPNAVSLNSATFNGARIVGPALAGVAISGVGTGWVFIANAVTYVAVLAGLTRMRPAEFWASHRQPRARGQLREGLTHVRERPELFVPILLVFMIGTFGLNFQQTLALIAKQTFRTGAGSFGLLTSALAFGSLLGALVSARQKGLPRQRTMFLAALAFGVLEVMDGLAPTFLTMALLLVPTGFAVLLFTTTANSLVQLACEPALRGRVMAIYVLVFLGGTPVGAPLVGVLAQTLGPRASLLIGGAVCAVSAVAAAALLARRSPDLLVTTRRTPQGLGHPDPGRSHRVVRALQHRG